MQKSSRKIEVVWLHNFDDADFFCAPIQDPKKAHTLMTGNDVNTRPEEGPYSHDEQWRQYKTLKFFVLLLSKLQGFGDCKCSMWWCLRLCPPSSEYVVTHHLSARPITRAQTAVVRAPVLLAAAVPTSTSTTSAAHQLQQLTGKTIGALLQSSSGSTLCMFRFSLPRTINVVYFRY